jgi:hydrogenase maturation protease
MTTNGSAGFGYTAPILVLGLGSTPSGDDGLGPILLDELARQYRYAGGFVEFVNGGTKGLDLLGHIVGRQAIVVLDALTTGAKPGTVSVLEGAEVLRYATGSSASVHPGDAHELLATAAFLGDLPEHFYVVGVQPGDLHQGAALSTQVQRSLQRAVAQAQKIIDGWLVELAEPVQA